MTAITRSYVLTNYTVRREQDGKVHYRHKFPVAPTPKCSLKSFVCDIVRSIRKYCDKHFTRLPKATFGVRKVEHVWDVQKEKIKLQAEGRRWKAVCAAREICPFDEMIDEGNKLKVIFGVGDIYEASTKAAELAKALNKMVYFDFNGKQIELQPTSSCDDGVKQYNPKLLIIDPVSVKETKAYHQRRNEFVLTRPNFANLEDVTKWLERYARLYCYDLKEQNQKILADFTKAGLTQELNQQFALRKQERIVGRMKITDEETNSEWRQRIGEVGYQKWFIGRSLNSITNHS